MLVLYLYDIKAKNKKKFNRTKRMFYYYLNKLSIKKDRWKSKSAIAVETNMEKTMDHFFKKFGKKIIVYKVMAETIEEL